MIVDIRELRPFIQDLSKTNDVLFYRDLFVRLIIHFSLIMSVIIFWRGGYLLLACIVSVFHFSTYSFMGLAGLSHELLHRSPLSRKKICKFLYRFFCVLTWSNYSYFEITHPHHHRKTLDMSDLEANSKRKMSKTDLFMSLTFDVMTFLRKIKIYSANAVGLFPKDLPPILQNRERKKRIIKASRVILLTHIAIVIFSILFNVGELIILIVFAPFFVTLPNKILASAQHFGVDENIDSENFLLNTRTVLLSRPMSFFYSNMNYHVEHHFFPSVPYYNLPALHRLMSARYSYPYLVAGFSALLKELKVRGYFNSQD